MSHFKFYSADLYKNIKLQYKEALYLRKFSLLKIVSWSDLIETIN
ncbi:hypothetical protein J671_3215 [Acinetobacter sp. 1130196]|nr:hypothetical protein J671_3215 [Acinetobacter sp. 1130196]